MSPPGRMDLKWYSKYVFLVGAILSFADPITDILTLVQFYREDHKTWFAVGLCFVFLPWVPFGNYYVVFEEPIISAVDQTRRAPSCNWLKLFFISFHPFAAAVARLKMFVFCLKNKNKAANTENKQVYHDAAAFFEAVLESSPQFVIQLYVISIQHGRVTVIQLISLPVSFLSLVWTFTSFEITNDVHLKRKCFLFVTNVFLLSSRLFAVAYFTVSYKWWIISVVLLHSIIMMVVGYVCSFRQNGRPRIQRFMSIHGAGEFIFGKFCVQWIKDDLLFFPLSNKNTIRWFANALFVNENLVMILLYYFSGHSNTWYALPVTVCVCSFIVLGGTMRIIHFHLQEKHGIIAPKILTEIRLPSLITPSSNSGTFYYYHETAV